MPGCHGGVPNGSVRGWGNPLKVFFCFWRVFKCLDMFRHVAILSFQASNETLALRTSRPNFSKATIMSSLDVGIGVAPMAGWWLWWWLQDRNQPKSEKMHPRVGLPTPKSFYLEARVHTGSRSSCGSLPFRIRYLGPKKSFALRLGVSQNWELQESNIQQLMSWLHRNWNMPSILELERPLWPCEAGSNNGFGWHNFTSIIQHHLNIIKTAVNPWRMALHY